MAFSESNLYQIEIFQQIHPECHCLVTSKAELIEFTKTLCKSIFGNSVLKIDIQECVH